MTSVTAYRMVSFVTEQRDAKVTQTTDAKSCQAMPLSVTAQKDPLVKHVIGHIEPSFETSFIIAVKICPYKEGSDFCSAARVPTLSTNQGVTTNYPTES